MIGAASVLHTEQLQHVLLGADRRLLELIIHWKSSGDVWIFQRVDFMELSGLHELRLAIRKLFSMGCRAGPSSAFSDPAQHYGCAVITQHT